MSATNWATTLHCDYPACESVADVRSLDEIPAGWLGLRRSMLMVTDAYGRQLADFCTLHAGVPLSTLAETMRKQAEETQ